MSLWEKSKPKEAAAVPQQHAAHLHRHCSDNCGSFPPTTSLGQLRLISTDIVRTKERRASDFLVDIYIVYLSSLCIQESLLLYREQLLLPAAAVPRESLLVVFIRYTGGGVRWGDEGRCSRGERAAGLVERRHLPR